MNLIILYEKNQKFRYNFVIFYRPDVIVLQKNKVSEIIRHNQSAYVPIWIHRKLYWQSFCGDTHFMMTRDASEKFAQMYNIVKYGNDNCTVACMNGKGDQQCYKYNFLKNTMNMSVGHTGIRGSREEHLVCAWFGHMCFSSYHAPFMKDYMFSRLHKIGVNISHVRANTQSNNIINNKCVQKLLNKST